MQSISFIVIFCFFIAKINCVVTTNYLDSKYNYLIKHIVNRTNTTRDTFLYNLTLKSDVHLPIDIQESILNAEDKGKICLRNLTKCMETDLDPTATNEIAKELFSRMPPFDLSKINGVSQSCQKDISRYIKDLGQFKMWALQMYDSSSKLPSGILNGNINQLGDFDMCLNAKSEDQIYGKYCLASMQFDAPPNLYLSGIYRLIHSHSHIKSNLDDPGHRVPRFSSINWALCVPNSCSNKDVEIGLRKSLGNLLKRDLKLKVKVDADLCQTKAEEKIVPTSTWIAVAVFIGFFATCCIAAIYDKYWTGENKNKWILAFSLNRNWSSMCTATQNTNDIKAVHGIRFVNALLLLFAHKSMALFFLPWTNRTEYIEYVSQPWSVIGRAASLFTDPFLMFSATLTTYAILGRLEKTKKLNLYQEYVSRLMRIVPTLSALIAFCTFILPWLNNGPMWNLVVTHHANICKRNWWRNLLFIHNYYGFEVMCLTHTHHVGIDTQLFIISPFLIFILWKWPKKGSELLIILALISTIMRYHVTYTLKLSNYVHFGTSIKQLFDTADYMYTLPIYRITVNIMGIFLGYALKFYGNIVLSQTQIRIGSALAFFSFLVSFLGPSFMGSIDYVYNPTDAAMYAAFSPILWCFSFAWIVWTAHLGIRNPVINFFIHPRWIYWTKISYTVYLTQFPAYFYNVGIVRSPEHYEFFRTMFNLKEYVWILVLSCTLTLMFEIPFQNIRNIIFKTSLGKTSNIEPKKKVS